VEDDGVVSPRSEEPEVHLEGIERREEIGDEDDHAPLGDGPRDLLDGRAHIGGAAGRLPVERVHEPAEVAGPVARGNIVDDLVVEGDQAHGIALGSQEIRERRGRGPRVLALGIRDRSVLHRPAPVDEEMARRFVSSSKRLI
jgi:hypothetical protein